MGRSCRRGQLVIPRGPRPSSVPGPSCPGEQAASLMLHVEGRAVSLTQAEHWKNRLDSSGQLNFPLVKTGSRLKKKKIHEIFPFE